MIHGDTAKDVSSTTVALIDSHTRMTRIETEGPGITSCVILEPAA